MLFGWKAKSILKAFVFALMSKQKAKQMKFAFVQSKSIFFALLFCFGFYFAHQCIGVAIWSQGPWIEVFFLKWKKNKSLSSRRLVKEKVICDFNRYKENYKKNSR